MTRILDYQQKNYYNYYNLNIYEKKTVISINKNDFAGAWLTRYEDTKSINWNYELIKNRLPMEWKGQFFIEILKKVVQKVI